MSKRVKLDLRLHPTLWGERQTTLLEWGYDKDLKDAKHIFEIVFSNEELQEIEIRAERCVWHRLEQDGDLPDSTSSETIGIYKGGKEDSMSVHIIGPLEVLEESLAFFLWAARQENQESILLRLEFAKPENYLIYLNDVAGFGARYNLERMGF